MRANSQPSSPLLIVFMLLCLAGAVFSGFSYSLHLALVSGEAVKPSFCNINSAVNCDHVLQSAWSSIGGISLAAIGLWYYLILFLLMSAALLRGRTRELVPVLVGLSLSSAIISTVLFLISKFVIGALCLLCSGVFVVNLLQAWLALRAWRNGGGSGALMGFVEGISTLMRAPFVLLGFGRGGSEYGLRDAWAAVGLGVLGILLVLMLKGIFVKTNTASDAVSKALIEWKNAAVSDLAVDTNKGVFGDYRRGPELAPVQIVEFADMECPFCRRFFSQLDALIKRFPDKISLIYRNFPLDPKCNRLMQGEGHKYSCFLAETARCAGEQNHYWEAVEDIFTSQAVEQGFPERALQADVFNGLSQLGVDMQGLNECLKSGRQKPSIAREVDIAAQFGIEGTPTVWVNGKRVPQVLLDAEGMEKIVNEVVGEVK